MIEESNVQDLKCKNYMVPEWHGDSPRTMLAFHTLAHRAAV